jgi:hypothetical protein
MNINNFCVDIIVSISSSLFINNLRSFILLDKSIYSHKYAILKNNKDIIKYMLYDTSTPYYYIIFDNTYANINANLYDYKFNDKELYAAANILSYYVINKVVRKEIAEIYLLNIFVRTKNKNYSSYRGNENIAISKIKNKRIRLCCKLFGSIFNYNWEYSNINLYDLFNVIYCIVYKRYNNIYDVLYNIRIHKSLEPISTMHILIGYENDITANINDANDATYIMIGIYKYSILYIIFNYIENIKDYIVKAKFNLLIQVIVNKCIEIEGILIENNYLPNKLKLLVLAKISKVYNIFAAIAAANV